MHVLTSDVSISQLSPPAHRFLTGIQAHQVIPTHTPLERYLNDILGIPNTSSAEAGAWKEGKAEFRLKKNK